MSDENEETRLGGAGTWYAEVIADVSASLRRDNLVETAELLDDAQIHLQLELKRKIEAAREGLHTGVSFKIVR